MARWIPGRGELPAGRGMLAPLLPPGPRARTRAPVRRWAGGAAGLCWALPVTTSLLAPLVLALLAAPPAGGDPPAEVEASDGAVEHEGEAPSSATETSSRSDAASSSRPKTPRPRGATAAATPRSSPDRASATSST